MDPFIILVHFLIVFLRSIMQADQLETQDGTIRQLKKRLDTDYK